MSLHRNYLASMLTHSMAVPRTQTLVWSDGVTMCDVWEVFISTRSLSETRAMTISMDARRPMLRCDDEAWRHSIVWDPQGVVNMYFESCRRYGSMARRTSPGNPHEEPLVSAAASASCLNIGAPVSVFLQSSMHDTDLIANCLRR